MSAHTKRGIVINDGGKVLVIFTALVGSFVLVALDRVEFEHLDILIGAVVGFVTGEGSIAVRKRAPSTMFAPNLGESEVATEDGPRTIRPEYLAAAARIMEADEQHEARHTGETPAVGDRTTGEIWANQPRYGRRKDPPQR